MHSVLAVHTYSMLTTRYDFTKSIIPFVPSNNPILQCMRILWIVIQIVNGSSRVFSQVNSRFHTLLNSVIYYFQVPINLKDQRKNNSSPINASLTTPISLPFICPDISLRSNSNLSLLIKLRMYPSCFLY